MGKVINPEEVKDYLADEQTIMVGGFMECGAPLKLIDILLAEGIKDLTLIANDTGFTDGKFGSLIVEKRARKVIASHIGLNKETGLQMNKGELEVELVPQGTLAERIRSYGAGLGGFYTPTGVGTVVEKGKNKKEINGKEYLLELPLGADIALIKAWQVDQAGNIIYSKSARNFNQVMAAAADIVIVEAEEIVPTGELDPNQIMTPGIFVDYIVDFS
ncbi:3-oxoacid CoA-transferase subunit A [Iocasia frigidifontis]|uniref:3-oxoacid CoA-transferase subunit A n=1 Tax=Iocasia fonsfrigidae TaxID=2682810 RepID=A0A8A7KH71_9FIRM|nr:3-oxoacid CoA-transferase subunit A [Iocasia fonsfrigidae]QTL99108.1 3-oxoacid CoA-transferase subunit A [Iocasia fonsfrigidae]